MKISNWTTELLLIFICLIPAAYLVYLWPELPDQVPMHWNQNGEIDRYGSKQELVYLSLGLPLFLYLLFLGIPKLDPKNKLSANVHGYKQIRIIITVLNSILCVFIINSASSSSVGNINYIIMGVGVLYLSLGYYMPSLPRNYFIGIRTPWTLEKESVWLATHKMSSKLWMFGGTAVIIASLLFSNDLLTTIFLVITLVLVIIPVIYSYLKF
ncbi:SdpI family protein [Flavobacteriaceae bacterium]|nr:SdpI family protein [Flavobacteriaceae bacterium]